MSDQQSALVEVSPGEFAVFGGIDLVGVTIEPAPLLPTATRRSLESAVSAAIAAGNLGAQTSAALANFEGLVRLSPEVLAKMRSGATPMSNGVYNLGSLTDSSGQIVQTIQWTSAAGATTVLGGATVGPALALLAIQMQLAKISRLVTEGVGLTDDVLVELRTERWATVEGHHKGMLAMVEEARAIGAVNDHIWQNVHGSELVLRSTREEFRQKLKGHLNRLDGANTPMQVRETLDHHGAAILADVQGLLQAQAAWFTYQAIRAGNLQFNIEKDPTAGEHLETVVSNARTQHEQYLADASRLVDAIVRRASSMVDAKASGSIPFGKKRRAAKEVAHAGKALAKQLNILHDSWGVTDPPVPSPEIRVLQYPHDEERWSRVIRWHLRRGEQLLAIAVAQDQSVARDEWAWDLQDHWLVVAVTSERLVVAKQKILNATGEIAGDIALGNVRYVRFRPGSGKPNRSDARMDITTRELDLKLKFADWATEGDMRTQVAALATLLQSQMRLPTTEVPPSPTSIDGTQRTAIPSATSS